MEPSDRPDCLARGVRLAGRRRDAACARHLHGRGHHGTGLSAVHVHDDVGVRDVDGVDVRDRARHRLFTVHSHAVPRGTARGARTGPGRRRRDGDLRPRRRAVRPDRHRIGHRHLPDQHPGSAIDGDGRDPRGGRRRTHVDDADPRRAGDVRARGGEAVMAAALVAAARDHPVEVLDQVDRLR